PAFGPGDIISELIAGFARLDSWQVSCGSKLHASDGDIQIAKTTTEFSLIERIGLAIGVPAEAECVDDRIRGNPCPPEFAVTNANGIVAVTRDACAAGGRQTGLDSVGRIPAKEVEFGHERVSVVHVVIEFSESEIVVIGAWNLAEEAGQKCVDRVALRRSGGAANPLLRRSVDDTSLHIAVDHRELPVSYIRCEEVEELVLDDCPADGAAAFHPLFGRVKTGERVVRIEAGAAEVVETGPVNGVGAALRHRVDDAAHGAAVFRREIVGDNLKLLYGVRSQLGLYTGASGVLVIELFGIVVAVQQESVVARNTPKAQEAEGCIV